MINQKLIFYKIKIIDWNMYVQGFFAGCTFDQSFLGFSRVNKALNELKQERPDLTFKIVIN